MSKSTWSPRSVGLEVLRSIVDLLDLSLEWAEGPQDFKRRHFSGRMSASEWKRLMRPVRERQAMKALQNKKWIEARAEGDKVVVELPYDAVAAILRERIRQTKKKLPAGSFCLAMFDFPVGADQARASWRRFLKSAEFQRRQLSVWTSDRDVISDMKRLVKLLRLENRVAIYWCQDE